MLGRALFRLCVSLGVKFAYFLNSMNSTFFTVFFVVVFFFIGKGACRCLKSVSTLKWHRYFLAEHAGMSQLKADALWSIPCEVPEV